MYDSLFRYLPYKSLLISLVEFSTFFAKQRVAKASQGLIPPPFLITFQYVFELNLLQIYTPKVYLPTFYK